MREAQSGATRHAGATRGVSVLALDHRVLGGEAIPSSSASCDPDCRGETSILVRQVIDSDDEASWAWLIARLTPFLELQARYRLRGPLRHRYECSDLLNDVWLRAYPRLRDLRPRDGRMTPVLLRFLSQILIYRVNELLRQQVRSRVTHSLARGDSSLSRGIPEPAADRWSAVSRQAARSEMRSRVLSAVAELSDKDQEVLILRGIEQLSNLETAARIGLRPGAVAMRYKRALARLRLRLPAVWTDGLP